MKTGIDARRRRLLREGSPGRGPVVYWMSRDQRVKDNWALLAAREDAAWRDCGLAVVFCLAPTFLGATRRAYDFLLRGLREVERDLRRLQIPFHLLEGDPVETLPTFLRDADAAELVTDFDPLRPKREWRVRISKALSIPFVEVDAHNIVPCRQASDKREWAAATLRPKIMRLLPAFLTDFPPLEALPGNAPLPAPVDWEAVSARLSCDESVGVVHGILPGECGAETALKNFLAHRLRGYAGARNDPNLDGQSRLSPWLHFGHLAPQRAALAVSRAVDVPDEDRAAFLEQLVVRRELADNFCLYEPNYDSFEATPAWAMRTLGEHRGDVRDRLYEYETFDGAATHDPLWNAAQTEMRVSGSMHGYLRMYWCKKLLEWSATPEEAWKTAVRLNDRYELDGRDPNGYTGIAWSIGGVHDRPWKSRPVFGSVRYMNDRGCRGKFDVDRYISTWLETNPASPREKVRKGRR
ncbi:MAG: Deoxyribodipyrimidine photo-lyase [bacterium ADurb.Bin374]|nr:MAG: Deoxyribodipyrimidine photo-lyase [bacterium ADurb.Bin374]